MIIPYQNIKIQPLEPENLNPPESADYGIHLKWNVQDILTATNNRDGQRSRFYKWNEENKGEISFFLCDSANFEKFKSKIDFTAYLSSTDRRRRCK